MIIKLLGQLLATLLQPLVNLLPVGQLPLPSPDGVASTLAGLDSLVPVLLPLQIGAGMLLALVGFIGFRVLVFLWHMVIP